jgi:hypothetical protein
LVQRLLRSVRWSAQFLSVASSIQKSATEIVIDDMQMLDRKPQEEEATTQANGQQTATTS